jgi:hypothetical protein
MAGKFSKEIQDAQNKLKALKKELEAFDDININIFDESSEDLTELNTQIKSAKALLQDLKPDLDYITKSFNDSLQSLTRQNHYLNLQKKGLRGIASQASHISDIKAGEVDTDEKSIKKAQQKYKQYLKDLELAKRREGISDSELENLNRQIKEAAVVEKGFEEVLETHKEINKQLGIAPQLASGLDKALQKIGLPSLGIDEALKETQALGQAAKETGDTGFKPMSTFLGKVGSNLKDSFSKANLLQGAIGGILTGISTADKSTGELAKELGMSSIRANSMRKEFADIANSSNDINVNIQDLQKSQIAVGKALGTNAMLNEGDLKTMTELVKKTGLQHDELIGIEKLSLATGKSLDSNIKSALGGATAYASQNKLVVDNNKVLREINNASDALKLSLGGSVEALGEAVVKAQQFGFNLEQAESIASSMLDFESSIENELSAELLTGKNLNLERARQLALEGDIASAAAEVADQLGNSEEFGKMNVIQQEALAKSVGLTRDQLASSLIEREALAKMSMVEGKTALERYNLLKSQGKSQSEIVELLGKEAAGQLEQQSNQDKFNATVDKLKGIFIQVGDALMPVFNMIGGVLEAIGPIANILGTVVKYTIDWGKYLLPIIAAYKVFQFTSKAILGLQVAFNSEKAIQLARENESILNSQVFQKFQKIGMALQKGKNMLALTFGNIQKSNILISARERAMSMASAVANIVKGAWSSLGAIPFLGAALAAAATVGGIAYLYSQSSKAEKVQDAAIDPKGGLIVSGPKGTYQGDPQDTVVMGTGIGKGKGTPQQGGGGGTAPKVDMTQTNALLQQLINVIQSGGTVTLDGQKVGEALKLGSFQTQ